MEFEVPGDFVDLHSYPLERLDHSITALSPYRIIKLPHKHITELIEAQPRLARILWFVTMLDASIHREWIASLGTRTGARRLAHLFCKMFYRLRSVGLTDGTSYRFPVTQVELGEALGFTSIHTNRMLRELRESSLMTFGRKTVDIHDLEALKNVAAFDPGYLYLEHRTG